MVARVPALVDHSSKMNISRYQLVDSLYGPGTVGAWLLTLCAILISWTLNTSSRCKDSISLDFIAGLLLPLIAIDHVIFQIIRLPVPVAEAITAQNVEVQRYASALEAPLNICETFSMAALILAVCCGPWWGIDPHWKRLGLVLVVGLLSWSTENVMFVMATIRGVRVENTTLSRPYLFLLSPLVASTWVFLGFCFVVGLVVWLTTRVFVRGPRNGFGHSERGPWVQRVALDRIERMQEHSGRVRQEAWRLERESRSLKWLSVVSMVFTPCTFLSSIFGITFRMTKDSSPDKYFILIPKSDGSLQSLDQILALAGSVITILAAIHRAYRSRVTQKQSLQLKRRRSI